MKIIKLLSGIIALLVIANVTYTNNSVEQGIALSNLSKEISVIAQQNTLLRSRIATLGSLTNLQDKLVAAGYTQSAKIVTLTRPSAVASR